MPTATIEMKLIAWDKIIKSCPWRFHVPHELSKAYCSAQTKECAPENCAVFHFTNTINTPAFSMPECAHDWVCADNKVISGASICLKCKEVRATEEIKKEIVNNE